ncbi:MAG: 2OG-Fe(II) oxygenase [Betaproteobacteria bacterium]|nr:2OG-Fe(II) oxygenase [Betaproteobacteria bacterium]
MRDAAPRCGSNRNEACASVVEGWRYPYGIAYANLLIVLDTLCQASQLDLQYHARDYGKHQCRAMAFRHPRHPAVADWHYDTYTSEPPVRKLTAVVNLSAPEEYIGGGLQVKADMVNTQFIREQGAGCWFPSYIEHRARAPIWGTRWVLVAWFTGPAWK